VRRGRGQGGSWTGSESKGGGEEQFFHRIPQWKWQVSDGL